MRQIYRGRTGTQTFRLARIIELDFEAGVPLASTALPPIRKPAPPLPQQSGSGAQENCGVLSYPWTGNLIAVRCGTLVDDGASLFARQGPQPQCQNRAQSLARGTGT